MASILSMSLKEMSETLAQFHAELRQTKFPDTYMIKFNPTTLAYDPVVNSLRGLIFNALSGQIYSIGFPVPFEFENLPAEDQAEHIKELHETGYTVHEAFDGALLRLWYRPEDGQWYLSTNGVEDAREAYWMNNISFADQFWSALPNLDLNRLNRDYVYLFNVCHPLNVIVVNHTVPEVYHVATYDRTTLLEVKAEIGVTHPAVYEMEVEDVIQATQDSRSCPVSSAGYMVVQKPDVNGHVTRYRFENINYSRARALRGDSNNIHYIILDHLLHSDPTPAEGVLTPISEFLMYYPIYRQTYNLIYTLLTRCAAQLFQEYGLRYKFHRNILVHPRHHKFLGELHTEVFLKQLQGQGRTLQYTDLTNFLQHQPTAKVLYILNIHNQ